MRSAQRVVPSAFDTLWDSPEASAIVMSYPADFPVHDFTGVSNKNGLSEYDYHRQSESEEWIVQGRPKY